MLLKLRLALYLVIHLRVCARKSVNGLLGVAHNKQRTVTKLIIILVIGKLPNKT